MPTFYAMVVASLAAYLVSMPIKGYLASGGAILSLIVWALVYYFVRKWLNQLRP